jgi:hypothetical protein
MINRRLVAAALVASVFINPTVVLAQDRDPIYNIRYYSDSTYMVEVGFDQGGCSYYGAGYVSHSGQSTQYTVYELIGYCHQGNWEPF